MALSFSSGLLTGLRNYGQGGALPADPRQRNAMQAAGVTNPLLQQFGQSLGGLLGAEMRSPAAIQQAEQQTQQEQARQVYSQALSASPEKQLELASQLVNIQGYETAAMKLAQQAQAKLQQGQETLARGQEEIASSLNQTRREQSLASAIQEKNPELASLVRQGDPDAYKRGVALLSSKEKEKEKLINTSVGLYDAEKGEWLTPPKKSENMTDKEVADLYSKFTSESVQNFIKNPQEPLIPLQENKEAAVYAQRRLAEANDAANTALSDYSKAISLANDLEKYKPVGGTLATVDEFVKSVAGAEDKVSTIRTQATNLRNKAAIRNLPTGPASDKDVALVIAGELSPNANAETLASYTKGVAKMLQSEAAYQQRKALWIDKNKSELGFATEERKRGLKEQLITIESDPTIPAEAIQKAKELFKDPKIAMEAGRQFQMKFGYDLYGTLTELQTLGRD